MLTRNPSLKDTPEKGFCNLEEIHMELHIIELTHEIHVALAKYDMMFHVFLTSICYEMWCHALRNS